MIYINEQKSIKCTGSTSLVLSFKYSPEIVNIIKQAGDAVWHSKELFWEIPCNKLAFLIDNLTYIDDIELNILECEDTTKLQLTQEYKTPPFDYQKQGIEWIINNKNGLLLDCPGLGKSLQVIYSAEELKAQEGLEHCLILCGINSLKTNWEKEIKRHSKLDCVIVGKKINSKGNVTYASVKERAEQLYQHINEFFVIINVESLRDNIVIDAIRNSKNKFDMIVFDEVHKCKSPTSDQGKNLLKLRQVGERHIGLTGTLLINNPLDAYVPLKFIGNENSTYTNFKQFYCVYSMQFGHNIITGFKNLDQLKTQIENCSLRRTKDLLNLPPKVIVPEYIEMGDKQNKFYEDLHNGIVEEADRVNIKTTSLLGLVTRLRQAASCPAILTSNNDIVSCKLERACELVDEIISNGEKVVIFSTFKEPLYRLSELLNNYKPVICTGDQSDDEVSKTIDKFQTDSKCNIMLATTSKMSTGITLTAASYMIFIDTPWTYSEFEQACDRIYRIGTSKTVIIYDLIATNTIDERVYKLINQKKGISDYIIDNKQTEDKDLRYLLGLENDLEGL